MAHLSAKFPIYKFPARLNIYIIQDADACLLLCRERPAVIANLSARVGSIGDNSLGGWYSYRASKTAQVSGGILALICQTARALAMTVLGHATSAQVTRVEHAVAAQNQLSKTMSVEFARRRQKVAVVSLHPGTVATDLSEPFQKVSVLMSSLLNLPDCLQGLCSG